MLTTKQRVDKVKAWIRQSCNCDDLFNVATVYDEVEGVSVRDCTKCSFSCSPGSASGVMVSVSQLYSHQNQVQENLVNKNVEKGEEADNLDNECVEKFEEVGNSVNKSVEKGKEVGNLDNKGAENCEEVGNLLNKSVEKGKEVGNLDNECVEKCEEVGNLVNKSVEKGKEVGNLENRSVEKGDKPENSKNNSVGNRRVGREIGYLESYPVKFRKIVEDRKGIQYSENNTEKGRVIFEDGNKLKNVGNESVKNRKILQNVEELENSGDNIVKGRKMVENGKELENSRNTLVRAREIVENGEELEYLGSKSVGDRKPVKNCKKQVYSEKNSVKNVDNGKQCDKLKSRFEENSEDNMELVENGEEFRSLRRGINDHLEGREIVEYQEESSVKKVRKLQKTPKNSGKNSKKNQGRRIFVEEEELEKGEGGGEDEEEGKVGENVEDVEKGGEVGNREGEEGRGGGGGGGAKGRSKRNSGGRRQPKKNCEGGNVSKNNLDRKENSDKSANSGKTTKNRKGVNSNQENWEEGGERVEVEGGRRGEEEGVEEEDVLRMEENVQTNGEREKKDRKKRFKISSQGMRVYINKKKPSWKKFIRTPCLTWTTDRTVEKGKKKRNNTDKRLKELSKFIANLDFEAQLKKGINRRRRRSKEEEERICTPQDNERKEEEEEYDDEKSSDTDWDDKKNIDLCKSFGKNRHRFRDRYTYSLQKPQEFKVTPKDENKRNPRKLGKRRRLLDCYSVWDEKEGHKKELVMMDEHKKELTMIDEHKKKLEIVFDDDEVSYNFDKFSVGCGRVLEDLFKERMEEERKTKKKRRGKGGGEKESGEGNEKSSKENRENSRMQENIEMEENFGQVDTTDNTNFEIRIRGGESFVNKQIANNPLLDAEGYLTGFGFLETTENDNIVVNGVENNDCKVLSDTVLVGNDRCKVLSETVHADRAALLDGTVQNENVDCGDNIPVILNKTVQFASTVHENVDRNISVQSKSDTNAIDTVNLIRNISMPSANITAENILEEIVHNENIGHSNERNLISEAVNGILEEIVQNENMGHSNERNTISEAVNKTIFSRRISHNRDLNAENIENSKVSSNNKTSKMPELRIVLTRCDDLVENSDGNLKEMKKRHENRKEKGKRRENRIENEKILKNRKEEEKIVENRNGDVDKEKTINEEVIEKRNRIFVTKSKTTNKQEKFIEKYISSIKKASNRARKYRKLKVQVVKSENLNKSFEKPSVFTEKIVEKKFNMTKFFRKSLSGSSGWSDLDEKLKQIDVKRSYVKLKVVKNCEKGVERSEDCGKIRENYEISGENDVRSDRNRGRLDKTHETSRKISKNIGKPGERKKLFDLDMGENQSTKSDVKRKQNVLSKQNKKDEDEPKRKLAKVDFTKGEGNFERMCKEDKEDRRNVNDKGRNNGNCERMVGKENRINMNGKEKRNTVEMGEKILKDVTNTRRNHGKITQNIRRVDDTVKENLLCESNSLQENISKQIVDIEGINDNIFITECFKQRVGSIEDVNEKFHENYVNNYENNELIGENFIMEAVAETGEQIEIIPESLDLVDQGILDKNIENSNVNIDIIPETLDFEGHKIVNKNEEKSNVNINIIPESLEFVDQGMLDKNVGKTNVNIEIVDKNIQTVDENLNFVGNEQNVEEMFEIVNKNTELNTETASKTVDENLETIENCVNLEAQIIVESEEWFVENSAPLDDEKNSILVLRPNKNSCYKFCDKNEVNEQDASKVQEILKINSVKNCCKSNNVHNKKCFNRNHEEIDNFQRIINQESNEGLEENESNSYNNQNTQQKFIDNDREGEKQTKNNIELNNNQSVYRRFKRNQSCVLFNICGKNHENESININGTNNNGLENNGTVVDSCMENSHGSNKYRLENSGKDYNCSTNSCGEDKNRGVENYGIGNEFGTNKSCGTNNDYGTNNTYGTNSTCGTSNYHKNSLNSMNIYEKLLQEDEEFFTNENLMTIDSNLNKMEDDIQFNELEIQLEGQLIEEFCEMLQDLEDDERFDRNLLKSFVKRLRGAPVRRLAFDTRGNVLVDGVKVVSDFEENQTFSGENQKVCSMVVENEETLMEDCEERMEQFVQTTQTQEKPFSSDNFTQNSKVLTNSKNFTKNNILSRSCGPDSRISTEDSSKIDNSTETHGLKYINSQVSLPKIMEISSRNYSTNSRIPERSSSNMNSTTENQCFNVRKYRNSQNYVSTASNSIALNSVSTSDKQKVFSLIENRLQSGNESCKSSEINRNEEEIQQVPFVFKGMLSTRVLGEMSRMKMLKFSN